MCYKECMCTCVTMNPWIYGTIYYSIWLSYVQFEQYAAFCLEVIWPFCVSAKTRANTDTNAWEWGLIPLILDCMECAWCPCARSSRQGNTRQCKYFCCFSVLVLFITILEQSVRGCELCVVFGLSLFIKTTKDVKTKIMCLGACNFAPWHKLHNVLDMSAECNNYTLLSIILLNSACVKHPSYIWYKWECNFKT